MGEARSSNCLSLPWPEVSGLLEILVCPRDGSSLEVAERVELRCSHGHSFPVKDRVPRMAEPPLDQQGTFESFTAKWLRATPDELRQRFEQQYRWYEERFGFDGDEGLARFLDGRERIAEFGTGLGGDAARFARLSDACVVGVDLSDSVEMAQREFGDLPNLTYVQADLLNPPFREGTLDFVSADQVIHHTPDTERAFVTLARLVAPGGELATYVYKRKALIRELADTRLRELTTAMSVDDCMEFSRQVAELGRALSRLDAKVELPEGVPLLGIEPGVHDVQRLVYWTFLKCFWREEFSENLNTLVNFDWYHPPYAFRHSVDELLRWSGNAGLQTVHLHEGESGISLRARRPS